MAAHIDVEYPNEGGDIHHTAEFNINGTCIECRIFRRYRNVAWLSSVEEDPEKEFDYVFKKGDISIPYPFSTFAGRMRRMKRWAGKTAKELVEHELSKELPPEQREPHYQEALEILFPETLKNF